MRNQEGQQDSGSIKTTAKIADKVIKVVVLTYNHRRTLAMVVGTILTILGYGDIVDGSVA